MPQEQYLGNPNLKKANTAFEFTATQIEEFIKCKDDPVYFAKKYIQIVSLDSGLVPFDPYDLFSLKTPRQTVELHEVAYPTNLLWHSLQKVLIDRLHRIPDNWSVEHQTL